MLKQALECHKELNRLDDVLRDLFDEVLSKKCKHYIADARPNGDLCDHEYGDGYCAINLCPLS